MKDGLSRQRLTSRNAKPTPKALKCQNRGYPQGLYIGNLNHDFVYPEAPKQFLFDYDLFSS